MRPLLITTSILVICVFTIMFSMTFFARDMIEDKARDFVAKKTTHYTEKAITTAEKILDSPLTKKLLTQKQHTAFSEEINSYRADPINYVKRLCARDKPEPSPKKGTISKISQKILGWKEKIRKHYNDTLAALVLDLRIFSGSNILAGILGLLLALKSGGKNAPYLLVSSALLILSLGLGIFYYADSMSFFTILFKNYFGWGYPITLLSTFAYLYLRYGHQTAQAIKQEADS